MSENIVQATVRLTIVGDAGRADLAVPLWSDLATVAQGYAERTDSAPVRFCTAGGSALSPTSSVHALRLAHGDVLVAVPEAEAPEPARGGRATVVQKTDDETESASRTDRPSVARRLAPAAGLLSGVAVGAAGLLGDGLVPSLAVGGLLIVVLLVGALADGTRRHDASWLAIAPVLAGVAALVVVGTDRPGSLELGVAAAALAAAAAAAALRAVRPEVADDALQVLVVAGLVAATIGAICLLLGWESTTFWALLLTAGVLAARFLPPLVVDVPDHVLLDFARLAATAWSAREQPRRSFRGVVREDDVRIVAERALRLVGAGSIVSSVTLVVAGGALLTADTSGARRIGILLMCLAAGAAFTLGGRNLRAAAARRWQRTAGTTLLLGAAGSVLLGLGDDWRTVTAVAAVLLGLLLAIVGRAAGRGWTSVWWSRAAEIAEGFAFVLVLGVLPLSAGLFDWMRLLTSP